MTKWCGSVIYAHSPVRLDVESVWDGNDALRVMEEKAFDVVLLDLRMPGLGGMDVLKRSRINGRTPRWWSSPATRLSRPSRRRCG